MMVAAVESGTGTRGADPGVVVAGKTGTAETGEPGVYHAWFVFFAPAENPVLAGAVVVESQVERLRRRDRGADREGAHAGDPSAGVERE